MENYISVAIPTYNSSKYLDDCLKRFVGLNIVNEIIIQDDNSSEKEIKNIKDILKNINSKKISLHINSENKGAFFNKIEAISNCNNKWVYQIDSDNIPSRKINNDIRFVLERNEPNNLYYPSTLYQFYNYPNFSKFLSLFIKKYIVRLFDEDTLLDINMIKDTLSNDKKITIDKNLLWVLNCGNFILHKDTFLERTKTIDKEAESFLYADAIAFSYYWISNGGIIFLKSNFYHHHRKRSDSLSINEGENTQLTIKYFKNKIFVS
tara:strand:- start:290 stop:1081 length:792 start_codon:yes stop_codon:yes gene_type:complete